MRDGGWGLGSARTSYGHSEPEHLSPNIVCVGGQIRTDDFPYKFIIPVFGFYMPLCEPNSV